MAGVFELKLIEGDNLTTHMEDKNRLTYHENCIRKDLAKVKECSVYIGYHLLDIQDEGLYRTIYHQHSHDYCKNIYQYAQQELDLCKTTVSNLMTIATTFSEPGLRTGLEPEYLDYSYSQLVELSTLPKDAHKYASPYMTIKQLREFKKGQQIYVRNPNDSAGSKYHKLPPEYVITPVSAVQTSEQLPYSPDYKTVKLDSDGKVKADNLNIDAAAWEQIEIIEYSEKFSYSDHGAPPSDAMLDALADAAYDKVVEVQQNDNLVKFPVPGRQATLFGQNAYEYLNFFSKDDLIDMLIKLSCDMSARIVISNKKHELAVKANLAKSVN